MHKKIATFFTFFFLLQNNLSAQNYCQFSEQYYQPIIEELKNGNKEIIQNLPNCLIQNKKLIFKILMHDPSQFENLPENLHQDKLFIKRLIKAYPEILKYTPPEIRSDEYFMEDAIYINRDSLKYCSWNLLDNKSFMKKMIDLDADNYQFGSDRIKSFEEFSRQALDDNGTLLEFATPNVKANKDFVKIAINSNRESIAYAHPKLSSDPELIELAKNPNPLPNPKDVETFLHNNYTTNHSKKNLGVLINNQAKFFPDNKILERNFITKWGRSFNFEDSKNGNLIEEWKLNPVGNRNYNILWQNDFKEYPELIKKIEKFFAKRRIAPEIISNLRANYIWKIKDKPLTIAFNLYGLSESNDDAFFENFINLTSITAIAQERDKKWQISVLDVTFNREVKINTAYEYGHKFYQIWDLYKVNEKDQNPKIIYRVHDFISDYFEIFEEQNNGKYRSVFKSKKIQGI